MRKKKILHLTKNKKLIEYNSRRKYLSAPKENIGDSHTKNIEELIKKENIKERE